MDVAEFLARYWSMLSQKLVISQAVSISKKGWENTHPFYMQIIIALHLSLLVSSFQLEASFPEKLNQPEAETYLLECQS